MVAKKIHLCFMAEKFHDKFLGKEGAEVTPAVEPVKAEATPAVEPMKAEAPTKMETPKMEEPAKTETK